MSQENDMEKFQLKNDQKVNPATISQGKVNEKTIIFEEKLQPSGSKGQKAGRVSKPCIKRLAQGKSPIKNTNEKILNMVSRLENKIDLIQAQNDETVTQVREFQTNFNTENLDKLMELAKTAMTVSLKNREEITTIQKENMERKEEMKEIRKELEEASNRNDKKVEDLGRSNEEKIREIIDEVRALTERNSKLEKEIEKINR